MELKRRLQPSVSVSVGSPIATLQLIVRVSDDSTQLKIRVNVETLLGAPPPLTLGVVQFYFSQKSEVFFFSLSIILNPPYRTVEVRYLRGILYYASSYFLVYACIRLCMYNIAGKWLGRATQRARMSPGLSTQGRVSSR